MSSRERPNLLDVVSSLSSVPGTRNQYAVKITRDWCTQQYVCLTAASLLHHSTG
ncbi:hypothetical protein ASPBRDRAFT_40134 [Aspergillus brasiliensis CBS 101740]|uniref:Uncharacterized protein n=1 Tax=Aspergillus brasiliensis (strain CBS 101740 / IMI 381727 / IBT 21946) TaxID=767769 RepID=A0A1L9UTH6_ASPBC|nr:hypothetical protein ASPBRDRAFT_40134 [Aspergillus brasiliensis CBS 101740]